jgi:hypothetical protein
VICLGFPCVSYLDVEAGGYFSLHTQNIWNVIADCLHADGMIIFPAAGIFADLGGVGVSMFFVTFVLLHVAFSQNPY